MFELLYQIQFGQTSLQKLWVLMTAFNIFILFPSFLLEKYLNPKVKITNKDGSYKVESRLIGWKHYNKAMKTYQIFTFCVAFEAVVLGIPAVRGQGFNTLRTLWRNYGNTAIALRQAAEYFYDKIGFCIFLYTVTNQQFANVICIGAILMTYLTRVAENVERPGEQANIMPPDWVYAPETYMRNLRDEGITIYEGDIADNVNHGHDPGELRRSIESYKDTIQYDVRKIEHASGTKSKRGNNYEWWHIGSYPNAHNSTSHFYGGGEAGGVYDTFVFGGLLDDFDPDANTIAKKRGDDGAHNIVMEFSNTDADHMITSSFAQDWRMKLYFSYDLAHEILNTGSGSIDSCIGVYDPSGALSWGFLHLTLSNTLEGLNNQDRYENFGQCYDSVISTT